MILVLLILCGSYIGEQVIKYCLVARFLKPREANRISLKKNEFSILILQPILSGDLSLEECLTKNLLATSKLNRHFLWLIDETDLEAQHICLLIKNKYPKQRITIKLLPNAPLNVNPKIFKLQIGSRFFTEDFIAVLDDDTVLPNFGLDKTVFTLLEEKSGLAFGLPFYKNFRSFWSGFVSLFVNSNSLLTYISYIRFIPPMTINGMFYVLSKKSFEKINGFKGLEYQLCDDFAMASKAKKHQLALIQTSVIHAISTTISTGTQCFQILIRWMIFTKVSILESASLKEKLVFLTVVVLPKFVLLILIILVSLIQSKLSFSILSIALLFQITIATIINTSYLKSVTPFHYLFALSIQNIIVPLIICSALLNSRSILWRRKKIVIKKNGTFKRVNPI